MEGEMDEALKQIAEWATRGEKLDQEVNDVHQAFRKAAESLGVRLDDLGSLSVRIYFSLGARVDGAELGWKVGGPRGDYRAFVQTPEAAIEDARPEVEEHFANAESIIKRFRAAIAGMQEGDA